MILRLIDKFMRIIEGLAAVLMVINAVYGLYNVINRYVFGKSDLWSGELMVYLYIWSLYLAFVVITYEENHLTSDFVEKVYFKNPTSKKMRRLVFHVVAMATSLLVSLGSINMIRNAYINQRLSESGLFPLAFVFAIIPISFALNALVSFALCFRQKAVQVSEWSDNK